MDHAEATPSSPTVPHGQVLPAKCTQQSEQPVYLDNNATTPLDPRVLQAMLPALTHAFGNPSASTYSQGWEAKSMVEAARKEVAELLGASSPQEVIFTSGATEANSLAIVGSMTCANSNLQHPHIITSLLEHSCVLEACRSLERRGLATVTYLGLSNQDGITRVADVAAALKPNTALVSIMLANNEIGVLNEVSDIAAMLQQKSKGAILFHVDGSQGVGKIPFNVRDHAIHFLSVSAHKWYGPKGVGALYVKSSAKHRLDALVQGGGQECGFRGGTENVPGIVGMGVAARLARESLEGGEGERLRALREYTLQRLEAGLLPRCRLRVNGSLDERIPGNLHFSVPGCNSEKVLARIREKVSFSSSSACSASTGKSHVLQALGVPPAWPSLRLGIGRCNTKADVELACDAIVAGVNEFFSHETLESQGPLGPLQPNIELCPEPSADLNCCRPRPSADLYCPRPRPSVDFKSHQKSALDLLDKTRVLGMQAVAIVENRHTNPLYINWAQEESQIKVTPQWRTALEGLEEYSHALIFWFMGRSEGPKETHVPQAQYANAPKVGIFATRCPQRPNPIACSLVKLLKVDHGTGVLLVRGLDAVRGSAVIDIKPYTQQMDDISIVRPGSCVKQPEWTEVLTY